MASPPPAAASTVAKRPTPRQKPAQQQQPQAPNIWALMNYPIPRGKCVHKPSLLTSSCPCLRFMLNPLQASSSFVCDGCGHHASFHALKGEEEGELIMSEGNGVGKRRLEIEDSDSPEVRKRGRK